jgi:hypothetical protein
MKPGQTTPVQRFGGHLLAGLLLLLVFAGAARADVVGRLRFTVKSASDEKVINGARIVLKDSANVRPNVTLTPGMSPLRRIRSRPIPAMSLSSRMSPPMSRFCWNR